MLYVCVAIHDRKLQQENKVTFFTLIAVIQLSLHELVTKWWHYFNYQNTKIQDVHFVGNLIQRSGGELHYRLKEIIHPELWDLILSNI